MKKNSAAILSVTNILLKTLFISVLLITSLTCNWNNVDYHARGAPIPFLENIRTFNVVSEKLEQKYSILYAPLVFDLIVFYLLVHIFLRHNKKRQ